MHMSAHLKALGHEVHGSYYIGGKRKKPENPGAVGAVKDHFSEGKQQEKPRQPACQGEQVEAEAMSFKEAETGGQDVYEARTAHQASPVLASELAVHTIRSLFKDVMPVAGLPVKEEKAQPQEQPVEPSLDDLLALMRNV